MRGPSRRSCGSWPRTPALDPPRPCRPRTDRRHRDRADAGVGRRRGGAVTRPNQAMLFERSLVNPILTAADVPYPANSVFNPGAARVGDETVLLVRVEDLRGISQLHVARSRDGITDWRFDPEPLLRSELERTPEEIWGCEDPR